MRLLVTRPEPDASREAELLAARGHQAVLAPLLTIEFDRDAPLELAGAQALLATSRNALRALASHPAREDAIKLPLLAVGDATAGEAQALGFADVTIGPGTGAKFAKLIVSEFEPGRGALVHLVRRDGRLRSEIGAGGAGLHCAAVRALSRDPVGRASG